MKPIHNQGKQALKRIRRHLGLPINRELLPEELRIKTVAGITSGKVINANPKSWERVIHCVVNE